MPRKNEEDRLKFKNNRTYSRSALVAELEKSKRTLRAPRRGGRRPAPTVLEQLGESVAEHAASEKFAADLAALPEIRRAADAVLDGLSLPEGSFDLDRARPRVASISAPRISDLRFPEVHVLAALAIEAPSPGALVGPVPEGLFRVRVAWKFQNFREQVTWSPEKFRLEVVL